MASLLAIKQGMVDLTALISVTDIHQRYNILVVGDGDLSYSNLLARSLPNNVRLFATTYGMV